MMLLQKIEKQRNYRPSFNLDCCVVAAQSFALRMQVYQRQHNMLLPGRPIVMQSPPQIDTFCLTAES